MAVLRSAGVFAGVIATVAAAFTGAFPIKLVHADELAYKLILGNPRRYLWGKNKGQIRFYGPGPRLAFMKVVQLVPERTWERINPVRELTVCLSNKLEFQVGMALVFKVSDPYLATYQRQKSIEQMMDVLCCTKLVEVFGAHDHTDLGDSKAVTEKLRAALVDVFAERGVMEFSVMLAPFHPQGDAAEILTAQARLGEIRRLVQKEHVPALVALALTGKNVILDAAGLPAAIPGLNRELDEDGFGAPHTNGNSHRSNGHSPDLTVVPGA